MFCETQNKLNKLVVDVMNINVIRIRIDKATSPFNETAHTNEFR